MNIRETVFKLKKVYEETATVFSEYQHKTGLACLSECGRCCTNPEVEATTLEMLPWALKVWDEGAAEEWLEKLQAPSQSHCLLFVPGTTPGSGKCSSYAERPGVCRMFAVAAYKNKHGSPVLSLCKYIRESVTADALPSDLSEAPLLSVGMDKITSLGTPEWLERRPLNQSMLNALQRVILSEQYRAQ